MFLSKEFVYHIKNSLWLKTSKLESMAAETFSFDPHITNILISYLPLLDILSLRLVSKKLYSLVSYVLYSKFKEKLFFSPSFAAKVFRLLGHEKYDMLRLFEYISALTIKTIIEYAQHDLEEMQKENEIMFDLCSYYDDPGLLKEEKIPWPLYFDGKVVRHEDQRIVVFLDEKYQLLSKIIDQYFNHTPKFIYKRAILPYYIGIKEFEVEEFYNVKFSSQWERFRELCLDRKLLHLSYRKEEKLSFPTGHSQDDNYWELTIPLMKLSSKWNLALERFIRGFLIGIYRIEARREDGHLFIGKLLFYGDYDIKIGINIIKQLHYIDCKSITYNTKGKKYYAGIEGTKDNLRELCPEKV